MKPAYSIPGHPYSKIVGTLARSFPRLILILRIRWAPGPSIVTSHRVFNLNDVCSVIEMRVRYKMKQFADQTCLNGSSMLPHTLNHPESEYSMAIKEAS